MPRCFVKTCSCPGRAQPADISLHSFPRDRERIRRWLEQLNIQSQDFDYLIEKIAASRTGNYRICSRHFKDDDYEMLGSHKILKKDAYPNQHLEGLSEIYATSDYLTYATHAEHNYSKRQRIEEELPSPYTSSSHAKTLQHSTALSHENIYMSSFTTLQSDPEASDCDLEETPYIDCIFEKSSASISSEREESLLMEVSQTHALQKKICKFCKHGFISSTKKKYWRIHRGIQCKLHKKTRNKKIQVEIKKPTFSVGIQCSLANLPPLEKFRILEEQSAVHPSSQVDASREQDINILSLTPIPRVDDIVGPAEGFLDLVHSMTPQKKTSDKDSSYCPPHPEEEMFHIKQMEDEKINLNKDDPELSFVYLPPEDRDRSIATQKKFLVFEECLDQLLHSACCMYNDKCTGRIAGLRKFLVGSALVVYAECTSKHKFKLWSSQPFIGCMPAGNLHISAAILCSGGHFQKMQNFFSLLEMCSISASTHYSNQKKYLFPTIENEWLAHRKKIIEDIGQKGVALLGDRQCDSPRYSAKYCTYSLMDAETNLILDFQVEQLESGHSSVIIEKLAFVEALNRVLSDLVHVKVIVTDRHVSIRKIVKQKYPKIRHEFDVWHMAKSVGAKIHAASKRKNCKELANWVSLAKNHLWWSSSTCQNNPTLLKEKWISISHHSANMHEWQGKHLYHRCSHPPISNDKCHEYEWLAIGSEAHHQLISIVEDARLLKELEHLSGFCHTREVEVFHSMVLKYCSKSHHFFMDAMVARTQLAAMDHNHNIHRIQAVIQKPSATSDIQGNLHISKAKKDWVASQVFLKDIICNAFDFAAGLKQFPWKSRQDTLPANIALFHRPEKQEQILKYLSRFPQNQ